MKGVHAAVRGSSGGYERGSWPVWVGAVASGALEFLDPRVWGGFGTGLSDAGEDQDLDRVLPGVNDGQSRSVLGHVRVGDVVT